MFYSFRTENKLEFHEKECKNKNFVILKMPSEDARMLGLNTTNLIKKQFTVYADLESLIEKTDENKNNPNNSSKTKSSKHILSSFSMSAISAFKSMEKKACLQR